MSFCFPSWDNAFSPSFYDDAKAMLETALNKGNKPPVIQGRIEVVDLNMGSQPPTLTLLEIGDLSLDRFRGILRLGYQGDAWITVRCLVQANPLSHNPNLIPSSTLPISTPLLASQPLLVPMTLRLSKLHLRAILILVVSKAKGITLVFKNDPLQNVDVSSTFDSVEVIRGYLQQEIEGQLREMFREDLPGIIHRLSQRWFTGSGGTVETPYRDGPEPVTPANTPQYDSDEDEPHLSRDPFAPASATPTPRRKGLHRPSTGSLKPSVPLGESPTSYTTFPDIENYDPTYGLRPEGLPTHSGYEALGRVWERARTGGRGLGSLMNASFDEALEHEEDLEDIDVVDEVVRSPMAMSPNTSRRSSASVASPDDGSTIAWEIFPAVGGGVVTRPRVFHAQSQIRAPSESGFGGAMPSPSGGTGSVTARASSVGGTSTVGSLRGRTPVFSHPPHPPLLRTLTNVSDARSRAQSLTSALRPASPSPSPLGGRPGSPLRANGTRHARGQSLSRSAASFPLPDSPPRRAVSHEPKPRSAVPPRLRERAPSLSGPRITLPLNNSVSQLATLSLSANTLSPYARAHEHIAVRSFPHLGRGVPSATAEDALEGNVKARRKRIFRVGASAPTSRRPSVDEPEADDTPPLEFASSSSGSASASRLRAPLSLSAKSVSVRNATTAYPFPKIPE
jgi:distribution and morphology protein 34